MQSKVHFTKKGAADVIEWAFDKHGAGILTTEHSASSYGQPVLLEDGGKLVDYGEIESLTFPYGTSDEMLTSARLLEPFGIRISRSVVDPAEYGE